MQEPEREITWKQAAKNDWAGLKPEREIIKGLIGLAVGLLVIAGFVLWDPLLSPILDILLSGGPAP